ncbi:MAG: hypothetical protein M3P22_02790 [bacterium]|nr:hypothetical protein [bacterium]
MLNKILRSQAEWRENYKNKEEKNEIFETLKMCHCCYAFKYAGAWHFEEPSYIKERDSEEEVSIKFTKCPNCIEELLSQFDREFA